ncbi:hypothetical protein GJ496_006086 [Pomphorhynchus laevis]|nr:hypothetical protein GJ496_006086 [Pomphorhynchus laevis]
MNNGGSTTAIMGMIVGQNSKIEKLMELMIESMIPISSADRNMYLKQVVNITPFRKFDYKCDSWINYYSQLYFAACGIKNEQTMKESLLA